MRMLRVFATTVSGLEDIAADEINRLTGIKARYDVGKVIFEADTRDVITLNYCSRSLHHIYILVSYGKGINSLEDIEKLCREVDYTEYIGEEQTFAVRAERHGEHSFISPEVAARVGHVIIDEFRKSTGKGLRVNLDEPDVEFYALVREDEFFLGINTSGKSLHRRYYRKWHHRAALLPSIAYAMLRIAEWKEDEKLLDPFCGGATIPIEAALLARNTPVGLKRGELALRNLRFFPKEELERIANNLLENERREVKPRIIASDASPKALEGAKINIEAASLRDEITLIQADVRAIDKHLKEQPDKIITNPPYGVRMGIADPEKFYEEALTALARAAPAANLVIIATKPKTIKKALEKTTWKINTARTIKYGTLQAQIFNITN